MCFNDVTYRLSYIKLSRKNDSISSDSYDEYGDHVAIGVETPMIDSRCSLEKEFTEIFCMNP